MTESGDFLARKAARRDEEEKEVKRVKKDKLFIFWDYVDLVKKEQSLALELEKTRRALEDAESTFPDLKQARGVADRVKRGKYYQVQVENKKILVEGEDPEKAKEKYLKGLQNAKELSEKMKKEAALKKAKLEES
jgi:hypothetical protein